MGLAFNHCLLKERFIVDYFNHQEILPEFALQLEHLRIIDEHRTGKYQDLFIARAKQNVPARLWKNSPR